MSVLSPTDVWAVGSLSEDRRFDTWVLHWNGKRWKRVPSPNPAPGKNPNELTAVAAVSADDVWAVGRYIARHPLGLAVVT